MNRIDRLTAILIQLQTKPWVKSSEISERYGIGLRTVYRDIRALEEAGVPLGSEPGKGYFLVEGFHLPPVMFTKEEAGAILIAGKLVAKMTDTSVNNNFCSATDKIKAVLPYSEKEYLEGLNHCVEVFFNHEAQKNNYQNNFLVAIQKALAGKKCLLIDYNIKHTGQNSKDRVVDPLGLVFYGGTWHLIGYCKLRKDMRDFRLDRISSLTIHKDCAGEKSPGALKKYFEEYWKKEELFEVKVWFSLKVAMELESSKYYFGFIDERHDNEGVLMTFAVTDYNFIAYWLLSFSGNIKIVSPVALKEHMVKIVEGLSKIYL